MCDIFSYPKEIIPTAENLYMDINQMLSDGLELYLIRRTEHKPEEYSFNGHKRLNEDALTTDVLNYSLNLMGGRFCEPHLCWRQLKNAQTSWSGGDVDIGLFSSDHIAQVNPYYAIYFKASVLHGMEIPYMQNFDTAHDYDAFKEKAELLKKVALEVWSSDHKEITATGVMFLKHAPIMLNYWHVVLDSYSAIDYNTPIDSAKTKWKKNLRNSVLLLMQSNYYLVRPAIDTIPNHYFLQ